MNALTLSASRRRAKVVKSLHLPASRKRVINLRSVVSVLMSALLSQRVALFAAATVGAVMYYHALKIADTVAMQRAIATDLLFLLPWAGAWLLRSIRKGGAR